MVVNMKKLGIINLLVERSALTKLQGWSMFYFFFKKQPVGGHILYNSVKNSSTTRQHRSTTSNLQHNPKVCRLIMRKNTLQFVTKLSLRMVEARDDFAFVSRIRQTFIPDPEYRIQLKKIQVGNINEIIAS
jgi:hypothetical protein